MPYANETIFNRFCKALAEWARASATLVSLTGHTSSAVRIWISSGEDAIVPPCLILDFGRTELYMPDMDELWTSEIRCTAIAASRVAALNIINALYSYASQNVSTHADASFAANGITTLSIYPKATEKHGQAEFVIESIRHTERSDITIPERHVAELKLQVTWRDDQ